MVCLKTDSLSILTQLLVLMQNCMLAEDMEARIRNHCACMSLISFCFLFSPQNGLPAFFFLLETCIFLFGVYAFQPLPFLPFFSLKIGSPGFHFIPVLISTSFFPSFFLVAFESIFNRSPSLFRSLVLFECKVTTFYILDARFHEMGDVENSEFSSKAGIFLGKH